MLNTPLGRAQHRMSQWSSDKGPDDKKAEIKEGFRIELAKHMDGLLDPNKRARDPTTLEYYQIADKSDLISAALIKVSEPTFPKEQMYEMVNYVNDKYKKLKDNFNFEAITSKNLHVDEFFRVYAEKIGLKE